MSIVLLQFVLLMLLQKKLQCCKSFLKIFAENFKVLRKQKGFTQEDLAYESGITLSQIARIETAKINPTICTLKILAQTLGVPLKEMFDF